MAESPAQVRKENKQSMQVLEQLMKKLSVSKPGDDAKGASQEIASFINGDIEEHEAPTKVVDGLTKMLNNKKDAAARQNACEAIAAIAKHADVAPIVQPYLVHLLPAVLNAVGDKMAPVKVSAQDAAISIVKAVNANSV
ncbi:translational elongation factor EF-1 alpha, partial [Teratosphaeriaceae sp. CCFEE 6253]